MNAIDVTVELIWK